MTEMTIKEKDYKEELIDTMADTLADLNWLQVAEILAKLDELVDQYHNI